jgi:hypothetical protein
MTRIQLQIIGKVVHGHARIKLASKGFAIDTTAIAITHEIIKLANKKL